MTAASTTLIADPFWRQAPGQAAETLRCGLNGLTTRDAQSRLALYGRNADRSARRERTSAAIGRRLVEPLSLILVVAAIMSGATGDLISAGLILAMLLLSIGLDMVQERRAMDAAEALRQSVAVRTRVVRDGREQLVAPEDLAPGDVIRLAAGEIVPADSLLLSADGCVVDEAALTGEPYPVRKRASETDAALPTEAINALFRGSVLQSGKATALVVATGKATVFGAAASVLAEAEGPSPFQRDLRSLGFLVVRLTGVLVLVVLAAHTLFGRPLLQSLMFATALAVGLTPELLPMITTVTLARGAVRLSARKVIVKRLASIHDLGAMTVLCTDKTGTLTEARISLDRSFGIHGAADGAPLRWAARAAALAGEDSAIDAALVAADPSAGAGCRLGDHAAFDFDRRLGWAAVQSEREDRLVVKGAPEAVLALCDALDDGGELRPMSDQDRGRILEQVRRLADEGLRCIAVAWAKAATLEPGEAHLACLGLCAFADPPKASAPAAIARLAAAGVSVRVLSGDHPEAVARLATMMGLKHKILTGDQIDRLTPAALRVRVRAAGAFARLAPAQKARIVKAFRDNGEVVGFLGDGINDAPGIKSADIGLSVDGAAGVARQAADMILLDTDLGVVADGVDEGRRTFLNILKYVRMGASSNFGNMLSMAAASLVLPFLPMLPIQILLNNLLYDMSEVGIPLDGAPAAEIAKPQRWSLPALLRFTLVMGAVSSLFDMATFWILGWGHPSSPAAFQTGWFLESMASQILVIFVIRVRGTPWSNRPHPALVGSSLGALGLAIALPFSPWAIAFGFQPPSPLRLAALAAVVVVYLMAAQLLKPWAEAGPRSGHAVGFFDLAHRPVRAKWQASES